MKKLILSVSFTLVTTGCGWDWERWRTDAGEKREGHVLEGEVQYENPCIDHRQNGRGDCVRVWADRAENGAFGGLYYLRGSLTAGQQFIHENKYDRSAIDERGYPIELHVITDPVTGVTLTVKDRQRVRLELQVDNPSGFGFGGTVSRLYKASILP